MKSLFSLLILLAGTSAMAVTAPTVLVTPNEVKHGDTVTVSVQMRGNTSSPSVTFPLVVTCQYFEEGATEPTILAPVSFDVTLMGVVGTPIRNPSWEVKLPPTWTMASNPSSTGYLAPKTTKTETGLNLVATLLPPDVTATTTWTMYAP